MERVLLTGGTGFVGGNVAAVLSSRGADVMCAVRRDPGPDFPWPWRTTDLTSASDIAAALSEHHSTTVLHLAINNDLAGLYRDRRAGFDSYVGITRHVVDAANTVGARVGYLSTDCVFDGTSSEAPEDLPVNPINLYGMFKALSEQTVIDRADSGFVARVGGVQGYHLTKPQMPRAQDCGFGYFVSSVVTELQGGRQFTVWQDEGINEIATPVTASDIGVQLCRALEANADGILHFVGADVVRRRQLAEMACEVFDLDPSLLRFGPVPVGERLPAPMPYDSSLSTPRTQEVLGIKPRPLVDLLSEMRDNGLEVESGAIAVGER